MLTGRLAKWAIILTEFDITYMPQKAIKGQALSDFLASHPIPSDSPLKCEFPDEEVMHIGEENRKCTLMARHQYDPPKANKFQRSGPE
jgi:hypothetical protein